MFSLSIFCSWQKQLDLIQLRIYELTAASCSDILTCPPSTTFADTTGPDPVVKPFFLSWRDNHAWSCWCHTGSSPSWSHGETSRLLSQMRPLVFLWSFVFLILLQFQIITSDSQTCPSLEMWLMSHLGWEDLGGGFQRAIKGITFFIGNMGSQCLQREIGVFWAIKMSDDSHRCNFTQWLLSKGWAP